MSNSRYQPRLKRGVIRNNNFILTSKNFEKLKKKKWTTFVKRRTEMAPLIRNDIFLIQSKVFDLRKSYKHGLLHKQAFFAFFSSFRKSFLKRIMYPCNRNLILNFIDKVELRLDFVLFRANFVNSLYAARSAINHKLVTINGVLVSSPTCELKKGDLVEVKFKELPKLEENTLNLPVEFLEVNHEIFSIVVLEKPSDDTLYGMAYFYRSFLGLSEIKNLKKFK